MKLKDDELIPGEEILYEGKLSNAYVRFPIYFSIAGVIVLAALVIFASVAPLSYARDYTFVIFGVLIFGAALLLVPIPTIVKRQVLKRTLVIALTNKQVRVRSGLFRKQSSDTPLDKSFGVSVYQPILGRIFNYGTIYSIPGIDKPNEFKREIIKAADNYKKETFGKID